MMHGCKPVKVTGTQRKLNNYILLPGWHNR